MVELERTWTSAARSPAPGAGTRWPPPASPASSRSAAVATRGRDAAGPALPASPARGGEARPLHPRGDLRRRGRPPAGSPTHGVVRGRARRRAGRALYVPEGCAHGFQTLVDDSDVFYMIPRRTCPRRRRASDGTTPLAIAWPVEPSGRSASATGRCPLGRSRPGRRAAPPRARRPRRGLALIDSLTVRRRRRGSRCRRRGSGPRGAPPPRLEPSADRAVEPPSTELRLPVW